jgi:hypothetical protein
MANILEVRLGAYTLLGQHADTFTLSSMLHQNKLDRWSMVNILEVSKEPIQRAAHHKVLAPHG